MGDEVYLSLSSCPNAPWRGYGFRLLKGSATAYGVNDLNLITLLQLVVVELAARDDLHVDFNGDTFIDQLLLFQ